MNEQKEKVTEPNFPTIRYRNEFLKNEFWLLSWNGASQRANIFPKDLSEKDRKLFRDSVKKSVFKLFDVFRLIDNLFESELIDNISKLVEKHNTNKTNFNIGHSQKLINLMLKYYWCAGWLRFEPPHCPVDRIILSKAKIKVDSKTPSWTKIDNIYEYENYISILKNVAYPLTLARWELKTFNRRN